MNWIHVVIPVYNAVLYLRETVESVLKQPYKGIDIVLVDDGSTDGSSELCDEIARTEERVAVIHQMNSGVSVARNRGIECFLNQCSGGYIAFLDADDLWVEDVVNEELFSELNNAFDFSVICFGCISSDAEVEHFSRPLCYKFSCKEGGNGVIWPMEGTFCACLYNTELLRKYNIRFTKGLKYCEDKIFKMQSVFLANHVYFRPEILHVYRENDRSTMRKVYSYSPIEYYIPIIDGWIASDQFVNSWEKISGKHINAGYTLASIYFGDMSAKHYQRWMRRKELEVICENHPYYRLYENMDPKAVSKKQYKNQQMHLKHPICYEVKHRLIGVALFAARLALKVKTIHKLRIQRKYPLQSIPKQ